MIETLNLSRKRTAILQNASSVTETTKINGVGELSFKLPAEDEKNKFCQPRHFVRCNDNLYRIMDVRADKKDNAYTTYKCEHVIATLVDDVLFGYHIVGNIGTYTNKVIEYVLSKQTTKNWVLDRCQFSRQFEYGWEQENLLAALFSVATPLATPYIWRYDTSVYPWRVSLDVLDTGAKPQYFVIGGLNLVSGTKKVDSSQVVTRLYCLGSGEGVNQLGIRDVNNNVPYLQAPQEVIDKYGLVSSIWTDRRFENADSLKETGQAMLNELMEPHTEYTLTAADVHHITGDELHRAEVGRITLFRDEGYKTYITQVVKNHDKDSDIKITVANKPTDIATSLADLADRQRVEAVYSQGATQLWGSPLQDNAAPNEPLVYNLWLPDDLRIMNKVTLKVKLERFRAYSRTTTYNGQSTQTSSAGGGGTQTSTAGGGSTQASSSDGESTRTSGASSRETSGVSGSGAWGSYSYIPAISGSTSQAYTSPEGGLHSHSVSAQAADAHRHLGGDHSHGMAHTHAVSTPAHTHSVSIPSHTHSVTFSTHTHTVNIPSHNHSVEYGIFYGNDTPTGGTIFVAGVQKHTFTDRAFEGDITDWPIVDGSIPRGRYIEIAIYPNANAYVVAAVASQGFIQSHTGGTY